VVRHASDATRALSFKFSLCAVPVATFCVFVVILGPCTFHELKYLSLKAEKEIHWVKFCCGHELSI
jgi:hypothetical protein